ncbi:uncharacterized protein LOC118180395, partial [Stegodyphus dumicola]|uniref:uncharacterized protein LOC118180395 n=1 Tax=Stegodyphus dumicola TaxID=202533 RepID=UPI0015A8D1C1
MVLYTCALYRAIHLELITSLSTDAFLLSFRRFVARRGRPRVVYTDNGTNFRGAYNNFLEIDWSKITRQTEIQKIEWKFIPPTAAWWGGWWERLVRVVKELLRRTLGRAVLTYEELETVMCECERVVNSRPLTYLSEDTEDLVSLTPAMFLTDRSNLDVTDIDTVDTNHLRKRIRFRAKLMEDLRVRFRKEYLGLLIQKRQQNSHFPNIRVNDVVLIGDDIKKRLNWPLARVTELIPGKDGKVRTVRLRTQTNNLVRPIQRVFPLEIQDDDLSGSCHPSDPQKHQSAVKSSDSHRGDDMSTSHHSEISGSPRSPDPTDVSD